MNTFVVVEVEYTYYLRLHIVGHETFCCLEEGYTLFTFIYIRS